MHHFNSTGLPIYVQPLSWNPAIFFRRARPICGGQVVEDIDDFYRLSLTLIDLLPEDDQSDIACEGFCNFDSAKGADAHGDDKRKGYRQTDYDVSGNVYLRSSSCYVQTDAWSFQPRKAISSSLLSPSD